MKEQPARPKRVTIRDVARAAGVSVGAASTALSQSNSTVALSRKTRDRIIQVAHELRYRPSAAARAMAGRRPRTIGLLATEYCMSGSFYSNVLRGVANQAEESGCGLILKVVPTRLEMQSTSFFTEHQIDGVIIPADAEPRTHDALLHYDIPHVWLNTELEQDQNCVHVDDTYGGEIATEHLISLGHRHIGFMHHYTGERHHTTLKREAGYIRAVERHGLRPAATYDEYLDIGRHVDIYLAQKPRPTGLVMYSDAMALLASNALVRRGVRIPQDMSVVGHEGVVLHQYAIVPLTTVCSPVAELGREAVNMLLRQIETGKPAPSVVLQGVLEVNESTAPPPGNSSKR